MGRQIIDIQYLIDSTIYVLSRWDVVVLISGEMKAINTTRAISHVRTAKNLLNCGNNMLRTFIIWYKWKIKSLTGNLCKNIIAITFLCYVIKKNAKLKVYSEICYLKAQSFGDII